MQCAFKTGVIFIFFMTNFSKIFVGLENDGKRLVTVLKLKAISVKKKNARTHTHIHFITRGAKPLLKDITIYKYRDLL